MYTDGFPSVTNTNNGPGDHGPIAAPQIEGYDIVGLLGSGGMGTVWHAVGLTSGRHEALKVMRSETLESQTARALPPGGRGSCSNGAPPYCPPI